MSATKTRPALCELIDHLREQDMIANRREQERFDVWGPVKVGVKLEKLDGVRFLYRGWTMNICEHGLAMLTEQELPIGSIVVVSLDDIAERPLSVAVRVVYCQPLLSNTFRVGGVFVDQAGSNTQAELNALRIPS